MGEILAISCTCGYAAEDLMVGCGMAGPDWCRDLAVCSHCSEIVTIRATVKRRACPACRRTVLVVPVPVFAGGGDDGGVLLETPCPRCGEEAMRVTETGVWD
jgi:hypothetical protein